MKNFQYYNPVRIVFGKDQIETLPELLKPYSKILFAYGMGSIKSNGIYERVTHHLQAYDYIEFGGIEPNPSYETLMKAVNICRNESVDFILAVGGGSVIDGVKFIAAAAKFENVDPWEILSKNAEVKSALKIGSILTLPATGSEMNGSSVITRKLSNEKLAFGSPFVMPVFSILDPETMISLPDIQISNGIVDAYVHVIEQYLTYPLQAMVQDKYAESLLKILIEIGPKLLENRSDYELNANFMWTATMALNGLLSCGVPTDWSTHMIGHELTALYGIDHAQTLAVILPGVMEVMKEYKHDKILQYAYSVFEIKEKNSNKSIQKAIEKTEEFFNAVGIKTRLRDYNIDESIVDIVAHRLSERKYIKLGEHRNIHPEIVKQILRSRL